MSKNYLDYFKLFPDFPQPGILFYDASPLLREPSILKQMMKGMEALALQQDFDLIAGIDARGFILGGMLAERLGKGFFMMRKAGKLPGKVFEVDYGLEYGKSTLTLQEGLLKPAEKVLIVDDVLATGGTAKASASLIEAAGASVAGIIFMLELSALKGRELLSAYSVESLLCA